MGFSCWMLLLSGSPAGGWSNGVNGCNAFGTHDWILKKAFGGRSEGVVGAFASSRGRPSDLASGAIAA